MTLTDAQRAALDTTRSTVVVAGAGSGKTTVLVARYLETLRCGVPGRGAVTPENIAAITFTDAAARNLKRRVAAVRPDLDVDDAPISTIHGFAARLLRMDVVARAAGLAAGEFRVMSPLERRAATRRMVEAWWDAAASSPNTAVARVAAEWNRAAIIRALETLVGDKVATQRWIATLSAATSESLATDWRRAYPQAFAEAEADATEGVRRLPVFAEVTVALATVVREVLAAIETDKSKRELLDHDDLLMGLDRALDDADVHRVLSDRYAAILVDEYQDVDPAQQSIVTKLVGAPDRSGARPGALFVVGDPKQSIYRFRGARPAAFANAVAVLGDAGATVDMDDNFRSVPPLLAILNAVTSNFLEAARQNGLDVPAPQPLIPRRPDNSPCSAAIPDPVTLFSVAKAENEMRAVADWISGVRARGVPLESIAILLRDRAHLSKLERALDDFAIPARVRAAGGFFRSAVARDFTNLFAVLADPADEIALLGFLRGPLVGVSDDALAILCTRDDATLRESVFAACRDELAEHDGRALALAQANLARWTALATLVPVRTLLADILRLTAAEAIYSGGEPESAAHLARLLRLADTAPQQSAREFHELLRVNLRTLERDAASDNDGAEVAEAGAENDRTAEAALGGGVDAGRVSVLTVHSAKGLEFPIVIIPGLDRPIERNAASFKCVEVDTAIGPRTELLLSRKDLFIVRAAVAARERNEEIAESLRVLYVALTRACDRLVLFYREGGRRDSWARRLIPALETAGVASKKYPAPPYAIAPAGDFNAKALSRKDPKKEASSLCVTAPLRQISPSASAPAPAPIPIVSPSRLHLLAECPLRYKFAVALGIPEPRVTPRPIEATRVSPTFRGAIVHRALERTVRAEPEFDIILDEFGVTDPSARAVLRIDALRAVAAFEADSVGCQGVAAPFQAREVAVEFPFDGVQIRGAIDFAYGDPATGAYGVIDYKSDVVAAKDVATRGADRGYDLQLALYALVIRDTFNARSVDAHIFWTTPGISVRIGFSPTELAASLARVRTLLASVVSGEFATPLDPPCDRCGYGTARICPSRMG
ncbi:MAG: UvrD-helicase domain-containing protein [Deltaproteobacteria bacterium]|nr:UvrD-helicase domain-containing protein [Deltaproteobacteria bacterium]